MSFGKIFLKNAMLAVCLLGHLTAQAQGDGQEPEERPLHTSVKISLMDMIDPSAPAFLATIEQKVAKGYTIQLEGGLITTFDGDYLRRDDIEGYKFRGEIRSYLPHSFSDNSFYYGLQFMYKHDSQHRTGNFLRANGNFFQRLNFEDTRDVLAVHFAAGVNLPLAGPTLLEVSGWAGLRRLKRTFEGVPDDADWQDNTAVRFLAEPGTYYIPSIGFALRVGMAW